MEKFFRLHRSCCGPSTKFSIVRLCLRWLGSLFSDAAAIFGGIHGKFFVGNLTNPAFLPSYPNNFKYAILIYFTHLACHPFSVLIDNYDPLLLFYILSSKRTTYSIV